jgi:hypothetical protein
VDVRCTGDDLPKLPDQIKSWFLQNAAVIEQGLQQLADKLQVGLDCDPWPLEFPVIKAPGGTKISIFCSSIRRINTKTLGDVLLELKKSFLTTVKHLPCVDMAV